MSQAPQPEPGPEGNLVLRELHKLTTDKGTHWLDITVTTRPVDADSPSLALPVRSDLGQRIANLICAAYGITAGGA